jgi:hypothetical protein
VGVTVAGRNNEYLYAGSKKSRRAQEPDMVACTERGGSLISRTLAGIPNMREPVINSRQSRLSYDMDSPFRHV